MARRFPRRVLIPVIGDGCVSFAGWENPAHKNLLRRLKSSAPGHGAGVTVPRVMLPE